MVELPQAAPTPGAGSAFALPSLGGGGTSPAEAMVQAQNQMSLPSMDPALGPGQAGQYGQMLMMQNVQQIQEMMQVSGQFTTVMKNNLQMLQQSATSIQQINALLANAANGLQQSGVGGGGGVGSGGGFSIPGHRMPEGGAPGAGGDQTETSDTRSLRQRFSEGRSMVHSMGSVSQRMAGYAASALENRRVGSWDTTPDASGQIHFKDADGNILQSMEGTPENIATAEQYGARIGRVRSLLGRYSAGESILGGEGGAFGALGGGLLKAAGPIGLAVGVADMGFKQFTNQTEAGAQYRAAYGTDAGRFALSQRAGGFEAGLGGYFGGIGFGRAQRNYESAAGMGLTGGRLDQATDFMNNMYTKLGLDTQQSAQAVQIAANNTNISLSDLSDNIMNVSKAAVDAGKNSETAVQSFLAVTSTLQQNVTNSSAAPQVASQLSQAMSANLPTSLNNSQYAQVYAGAINQQNIGLVASASGQDFRVLSQQVASGQSNAALSVVGGTINLALDAICRAGGAGSADQLRAAIQQKYPGQKSLTGVQQQDVLSAYPNMTPGMMSQVFALYQMPVNPGDVFNFFFSNLLSPINQVGGGGAAETGSGGSPIVKGGATSDFLSMGRGAANSPIVQALGIQPHQVVSARASIPTYTADDNQSAYIDWAKSTGNRDKAVEALLRNQKDVLSFTGKKSLDDVQFKTSDGKSHSFQEILKSPSLLAEFDKGTPSIQGTGNNMESVGDVTNYTQTGLGSSSGGGTSKANSQGALITLTPYAQRIFQLAGPSDAQAQGVPPVGAVSPNNYGR